MENLVISDTHADHTDMIVSELKRLDGIKRVFAVGDFCDGDHRFIAALGNIFAGIPVFATIGNHGYMRDGSPNGWTMEGALQLAYEAAAKTSNVTVLENETVVHDGLRIVGATLWTAFDLVPPAYSLKMAMYQAQNGMLPSDREHGVRRGARMTDYGKIRYVDEDGRERTFTPSHSIALHKQSRAYIESQLAIEHDGPTVVLSHHCPHPNSLRDASAPNFSDLDFCYASDLSEILESENAPEVWCHGHVHESRDYVVGNTRIVANPRGYPTPGGTENPHWNPSFTIDIEKREPTPGMRIR